MLVRDKLRKFIYILARFLISFVLLWYLFTNIDIKSIVKSLESVNFLWLLLALSTHAVGKVLGGYRWKILLSAQGMRIPLPVLVSSLMVGGFFNNLLPTTVGGDAVRAYDAARYSGETLTSNVATVITERVLGVLALSILGVLALIFGFWQDANISSYLVVIMIILSLSLIAFILLFNRVIGTKIVRILQSLGFARFGSEFIAGFETFQVLAISRKALLTAFALSSLLQLNVVLHYYLISLSLDLNISLLYFFIIIPIALVVLLFPFSINGIGLRENIYVILLARIGVLASDAVALSWLAFGMLVLQGVVGGILFGLRGMSIKRQAEKAVSKLTEESI